MAISEICPRDLGFGAAKKYDDECRLLKSVFNLEWFAIHDEL